MLTAKSKERGEILRKVFETEAFESLQQKLSEKKRGNMPENVNAKIRICFGSCRESKKRMIFHRWNSF